MKMTTQAACACRFSFFGHETGYHEHLLEHIKLVRQEAEFQIA